MYFTCLSKANTFELYLFKIVSCWDKIHTFLKLTYEKDICIDATMPDFNQCIASNRKKKYH